jgi:putative N6-adenine-specific DNA methylase
VELLTRTEGKELLRKASDLIAKLPEEGPPNKTAAIEAIRQAVERMSAVQDILDEAGFGDRIVYDLGMAADLQYYTGVIFQAFTPGSGEYILDGGRYNELYRQFGKAVKNLNGWKMYILSSHTEFERTFGRTADKKRKLYNGMIKCDLFMFR